MRWSIAASQALGAVTAVTALTLPRFEARLAATLPLDTFGWFETMTLEEAQAGVVKEHTSHGLMNTVIKPAGSSNDTSVSDVETDQDDQDADSCYSSGINQDATNPYDQPPSPSGSSSSSASTSLLGSASTVLSSPSSSSFSFSSSSSPSSSSSSSSSPILPASESALPDFASSGSLSSQASSQIPTSSVAGSSIILLSVAGSSISKFPVSFLPTTSSSGPSFIQSFLPSPTISLSSVSVLASSIIHFSQSSLQISSSTSPFHDTSPSTTSTPNSSPSGTSTTGISFSSSSTSGSPSSTISFSETTSSKLTAASPLAPISSALISSFSVSFLSFATPASSSAASTTYSSSQSPSQTASPAATCKNPNIRFEWQNYSDSDRRAYVQAMKCLMEKPSVGGYSPSTSRWEDLVRVHQNMTATIHGNNKFLLWHRYFTFSFEQIMRNECGFDRAFPWWDETQDAGAFADSTMFTDDYFGTLSTATVNAAGLSAGTCVTDGQFANLTCHIGPGMAFVEHCLSRAVDEGLTAQSNSDFVDACNSRDVFSEMANCAELGPHAYGHNGIGSVMADVSSSPSDPIFFMHHLFIDRNFWAWQGNDVDRLSTVDGCTDADNPCTPLTLDTPITVAGLAPDVTVGDILNTQGGVLCYVYDS